MSEQPDGPPHAAEGISRQPPRFARAARKLTMLTGSGWSIVAVAIGLGVWLVVGWELRFPRGWELVATAGLPVFTLVLLVIVQHTQNHDDRAIQLKLDEVIRALDRASNSMIRVDEGSSEDLEHVREQFQKHVADAPGEPATGGRAGSHGSRSKRRNTRSR